jgi:hypothetical protein
MQNAAEVMSQKLAWLVDSWTSIEIRQREDARAPDGAGHETRETYIETALGWRLYETATPQPKLENRLLRNVVYYDGKRFAESKYDDKWQIGIMYRKGFGMETDVPSSQRPMPLCYLYLDHLPLSKSILKAESLGRETLLGRECEVLVLKGTKWTFAPVDIVYRLDRETGVPLAVHCYEAGADRGSDKPHWSWEAQSFDRVAEGRYWPMRSIARDYVPSESGGKVVAATRDIVVEAIHFDKPYTEATFRPEMQPGTPILDTVNGKTDVVPGKRADQPPPPSAAPVVAERPPDWTQTASTAGLGLGLALLLTGLGLRWWKQRA